MAVSRALAGVKVVGYTHRGSTRAKARRLRVTDEVVGDVKSSVRGADLVILATPICTFEQIFGEIADSLPAGCIVTEVGSSKQMPHRWARKRLPRTVRYVGSHPIAGSEQRGVEYARDDLFDKALCILTRAKNTDRQAVEVLKRFWSALGCTVQVMTPAEHDRILANVSHLPHIAAAALINASNEKDLRFSGRGFMDTSRIASGPANLWADVLLTNAKNSSRGIDRITRELAKLKSAITEGDKGKIEKLLEAARRKRSSVVKYKMKKRELI